MEELTRRLVALGLVLPPVAVALTAPGTAQNASDGLFDASLLLRRYRKAGAKRTARFDFVLDA